MWCFVFHLNYLFMLYCLDSKFSLFINVFDELCGTSEQGVEQQAAIATSCVNLALSSWEHALSRPLGRQLIENRENCSIPVIDELH